MEQDLQIGFSLQKCESKSKTNQFLVPFKRLKIRHNISSRKDQVIDMDKPLIRLTMIHMAPRYDHLEHNLVRLEEALHRSLEIKPDLILTPELALSGYEFRDTLGTDWIPEIVPPFITRLAGFARKNSTALVLGTPLLDPESNCLRNSAVFIAESGKIAGVHHKINVLPGGSETWAVPGEAVNALSWRSQSLGMLICSDAYTKTIAEQLPAQGAKAILSPAAWSPGIYGPNGEWEQRSLETGLPFYVCNRTGQEKLMDFRGGSSVVVAEGERILEYSDPQPAILTVPINPENWLPAESRFEIDLI